MAGGGGGRAGGGERDKTDQVTADRKEKCPRAPDGQWGKELVCETVKEELFGGSRICRVY